MLSPFDTKSSWRARETIDGPLSTAVPVINRFISLREHRARFRAGDHPIEHLRGQPFGRPRGCFPSNGVVTTVSGGITHLWRPASIFSGTGELKIDYSMRELGFEGFRTGTCAADVSQDLLFFSRKHPNSMYVQISGLVYTPRVVKFRCRLRDCFIYSLGKGRPHPDAYQSHISSSIVSNEWPDYQSWDSIQVLRDLFAWNVPHHSDARRCEMGVINWKTGVTAWVRNLFLLNVIVKLH